MRRLSRFKRSNPSKIRSQRTRPENGLKTLTSRLGWVASWAATTSDTARFVSSTSKRTFTPRSAAAARRASSDRPLWSAS